jgi:hypothetical protein
MRFGTGADQEPSAPEVIELHGHVRAAFETEKIGDIP